MQIGVNLWTVYGWKPQFALTESILDALHSAGAQVIEIVLDWDHFSPEVLLSAQPRLSEYMWQRGMTVPSIATALFWQFNPASQSPDVQAEVTRIIHAQCEVAHAYGATMILVVPGMQEPRTAYNCTYDKAVEVIRKAAQHAAQFGLSIALENVATSLLQSPREFQQFIRDVDCANVGAYIDTGNVFAARQDYPENWISAFPNNILAVHAKDFDASDTSLKGFRLCGEGSVNWDESFAALRQAKFDGPIFIETPPNSGINHSVVAGLHAASTGLQWLRRYVSA